MTYNNVQYNEAIELFDDIFMKKDDPVTECYDWMESSIASWVSSETIKSFHPFSNFFPLYEEDIVYAFSKLGENFREAKEDGEVFSQKKVFSKSLIKLLSKKNYYLDNHKAWEFVLNVISEMRINESVPELTRLINLEIFRNTNKEMGYDFFTSSFEVVYKFGPSEEARDFFNIVIGHINEYPRLSLKLLESLLEINPKDSKLYLHDKKIRNAIKIYTNELYSARNYSRRQTIPLLNIFAKKYNELLLNDEYFIEFFEACQENYFDFLLAASRIEQIKEHRRVSEAIKKQHKISTIARKTPKDVRGFAAIQTGRENRYA